MRRTYKCPNDPYGMKAEKGPERALKERKALSYEDVPLEQYDQEEIKLKRPPKKSDPLTADFGFMQSGGDFVG